MQSFLGARPWRRDVLLAWENEASSTSLKELGADRFDIVYPPLGILAEPPVTLVDKNVGRKGTRAVAQAYLEYLHSPGEEIAALPLLSPHRHQGGRRPCPAVPEAEPLHHRRGPWQLDPSAADALQRRRRVRQGLYLKVSVYSRK